MTSLTRRLPPARLEDWLRDAYFDAAFDISSSGVEPYTLGEARARLGLETAELDALLLDDSRTCGDPALRAAIARLWGSGDPDGVLVANGSNEALFLILTALLEPGDSVVCVEPSYHALGALAHAVGCDVTAWPLRAQDGFAPDVEELRSLVGGGTRAILVNFPHNPTGATVTRDEQAAIVEIARAAGAYLLWDAAFAPLALDEPPLPDVSTLYERGVSFGTVSKAFGLPGLRMGWALGPPELIDRCVRTRDYTALYTSPLVEIVARRAMERPDALIAPRLAQARRNRALLADWAAAEAARIDLRLPAAGVVTFPRLEGVGDVEKFCEALLAREGVLLIPGACFGRPEHVRLGFGGRTPVLEAGLARLSDALSPRAFVAPSITAERTLT